MLREKKLSSYLERVLVLVERELGFSSFERVELFLLGELSFFPCEIFFVETKRELGFIYEGVEFLSCTESNFRERIVLSCLRDWSFFFASRRVELVEMGFCFVWMFFFLFFVSWFFLFFLEGSFFLERVEFSVDGVAYCNWGCFFRFRQCYCSFNLQCFSSEGIEFSSFEGEWCFVSWFFSFMKELSFFSFVRGLNCFLFFLRELFLFFTERDRELVLSRESLLFFHTKVEFVSWMRFFSLFSERVKFFLQQHRYCCLPLCFFTQISVFLHECNQIFLERVECSVLLKEMSFLLRDSWVFLWDSWFFCFVCNGRGIFSWVSCFLSWVSWDYPFLETVEFFQYRGCFFFLLYWEFSFFVFDREEELRSLFHWDRCFSSSWEFELFLFWEVWGFQLRDFAFFFLKETSCFSQESSGFVSLWKSRCFIYFRDLGFASLERVAIICLGWVMFFFARAGSVSLKRENWVFFFGVRWIFSFERGWVLFFSSQGWVFLLLRVLSLIFSWEFFLRERESWVSFVFNALFCQNERQFFLVRVFFFFLDRVEFWSSLEWIFPLRELRFFDES